VIVETQVNLSVMFLKFSPRRCRIALVMWIEKLPIIHWTGKVQLIALRYLWTIIRGQKLEVVIVVVVVPLILIIQFIYFIVGRGG
jgi:hypothetical protein